MDISGIDKQLCSGDQSQVTVSIAVNDSEMKISVTDLERFAQMGHRSDVCISIIGKDSRGQSRQIHDEACKTKCFQLLQQLAREFSYPIENLPGEKSKEMR